MDSGLIKTNLSKKQEAFFHLPVPLEAQKLREQCGAAPQLLFIATALWATAEHYCKQIYPSLHLSQLWQKTWACSVLSLKAFSKEANKQLRAMVDSPSGMSKRPRQVCSRTSVGISRDCFGQVISLWEDHCSHLFIFFLGNRPSSQQPPEFWTSTFKPLIPQEDIGGMNIKARLLS